MKIAVTGGSGIVGDAVLKLARERGHEVRSIDRATPAQRREGVDYVAADTSDYEGLCAAFAGCEAVIHLAAFPRPGIVADHITHNNNVVGSYNALAAAVAMGIGRICQASSVNAIGLSYSRQPRFDYFPVDEQHPNYAEEAYSLSKWICEQQADAFVRRHEGLSIASMRLHWVVADRDIAERGMGVTREETAKHLWAYTLGRAAADACLLSIDGRLKGHEVFYIVAPQTAAATPSEELARRFYPDVPIRGDLSGRRSFFDSSKAERLLGWRHDG